VGQIVFRRQRRRDEKAWASQTSAGRHGDAGTVGLGIPNGRKLSDRLGAITEAGECAGGLNSVAHRDILQSLRHRRFILLRVHPPGRRSSELLQEPDIFTISSAMCRMLANPVALRIFMEPMA